MGPRLDPQRTFCRVCSYGLHTKHHTGSGLVTYEHPLGIVADHEPQPCDVGELDDPLMFCDFCSALRPELLYRCSADLTSQHQRIDAARVGARDYRDHHGAARILSVAAVTKGDLMRQGDTWRACVGCAPYLEDGDMAGLITRVCGVMPKPLRGRRLIERRGVLAAMYEPIFATLVAGRWRVRPGSDIDGEFEVTDRTSLR